MARAKTIISAKIQNGATATTAQIILRGKGRADVIGVVRGVKYTKRHKVSTKAGMNKAFRDYSRFVRESASLSDTGVAQTLGAVKRGGAK